MFRFKRKCHEYGDAIRVINGIVYLCFCIAPNELDGFTLKGTK